MKGYLISIIAVACLISSIYCNGTVGSSYTLQYDALKYAFNGLIKVVFPSKSLFIGESRAVESYKLDLYSVYQNLEELSYQISHTVVGDLYKFTLSNNYFQVSALVQNLITQKYYPTLIYATLSYDLLFSINGQGSIQINDITESNIICTGYGDPMQNQKEFMMQGIVTSLKQYITNKFKLQINSINNYLSNLPRETLLPTINVLLNLSFNQYTSKTPYNLAQNMYGMENSVLKDIPSYTNSMEFPPQQSEKDVVFLLNEYTLNTISTILFNDLKFVGSINELVFPESFSEGIKYFQQVGCSFSSQIKLESAPTFEITNSEIIINADNLTIETYAQSSCGQPALINKITSSVQFVVSATLVQNKSIKLTVIQSTLVNFVQLINYMNYVDGYEVQNFIQNTLNSNILKINQTFFIDTIPFNLNRFNFSQATLSLIDNFIRIEATLQK